MKKLIFLILTFILILTPPLMAQKKNKQTSTDQIIAYITYDSILVNLKEYPKMVKLIEAYQKQLVSEYELKSLEFEALLDEYKEKEGVLSDEEITPKLQKLQDLNKELEELRNEFDQKIFAKEKELLKPLNEKIKAAIEEVSKEHGYTHVVEKKNFYYISDTFDANALVIAIANKTH